LPQTRLVSETWTPGAYEVPAKDGVVRFHDLDLPDAIMHAVADLEFQYCTPIQEQVLTRRSKGENIAGRAQTGTGKTAAFLITMLEVFHNQPRGEGARAGSARALVLAPTRELVVQIVRDAESLARHMDVSALAVFGGTGMDAQLGRLQSGPVDIVAATPGRLLDFLGRGVLDLSEVDFVVIDEADRMLDMGFIPDVRRIMRRVRDKHRRRTMLFSATLTSTVLRLAGEWMPEPVVVEVEPEQVAVDTVDQRIYAVPVRQKFPLLYNLLQRPELTRVLVFANRRDRAMRVADHLKAHGISCDLLSGDVEQRKRMRILDAFRSGDTRVLVATDVAGRGLHIDNISHVINFDFPYEPEDYVHRIGRTGRAGTAGVAISFACEDESFIIPEIEAYIGRSLSCGLPEESLLSPVPHVEVRESRRPSVRRSGGSRSNSARGSGGRRPGMGRRSGGPRRSPRR
jgi:ATP-dependent RNA helicase RhlB